MKNVRILYTLLPIIFLSCEKNDTDVDALYRRWDFQRKDRVYNENPGDPNSSPKRFSYSYDDEDYQRFYKFHADQSVDSHNGPGIFRTSGDSIYLDFNGNISGFRYALRKRELSLTQTTNDSDYYEEVTWVLRAR